MRKAFSAALHLLAWLLFPAAAPLSKQRKAPFTVHRFGRALHLAIQSAQKAHTHQGVYFILLPPKKPPSRE
jgi:hypothetical protein